MNFHDTSTNFAIKRAVVLLGAGCNLLRFGALRPSALSSTLYKIVHVQKISYVAISSRTCSKGK